MRSLIISIFIIISTTALASNLHSINDSFHSIGDLSDHSSHKLIPNNSWSSVLPQPDSKNIHELTVDKFISSGYGTAVDLSKLSLAWPIQDQDRSLLTRFGTPTVLKMNSSGAVYTHESFDITRSTTAISDEVVSPVNGIAIVMKEEGDDSNYSTAVTILDERSHIIISLLHVKPSKFLSDSFFIKVSKGQVIGNLSLVESMPDPIKQEIYKHTHMTLIDASKNQLVNPSYYIPDYLDTIEPTIEDVFLFDELGLKHSNLVNGKIDLAVMAFDRDNISNRNFEIGNLSATVRDHQNKVLFQLKECNLDMLTNGVTNQEIKDAFYLDYAGLYLNSDFGFFLTNATVRDRSFSYAVTNFKITQNNCSLEKDIDGYFVVTNEVEFISVEIKVLDHNRNETTVTKYFYR